MKQAWTSNEPENVSMSPLPIYKRKVKKRAMTCGWGASPARFECCLKVRGDILTSFGTTFENCSPFGPMFASLLAEFCFGRRPISNTIFAWPLQIRTRKLPTTNRVLSSLSPHVNVCSFLRVFWNPFCFTERKSYLCLPNKRRDVFPGKRPDKKIYQKNDKAFGV